MTGSYGVFIEEGFRDCCRDIRREASRAPRDTERLYALFLLLKDLNAQLKTLPEDLVYETGRLYMAPDGGAGFAARLLDITRELEAETKAAPPEKHEIYRVFTVHFDPCAELLDVRALYMAKTLKKLSSGAVKYSKSGDYSYDFMLSKSLETGCFSDFPYVLETEGKNA